MPSLSLIEVTPSLAHWRAKEIRKYRSHPNERSSSLLAMFIMSLERKKDNFFIVTFLLHSLMLYAHLLLHMYGNNLIPIVDYSQKHTHKMLIHVFVNIMM